VGVKRLGREADHLFSSSAKLKNESSYTSTPPICIQDVVLSLKKSTETTFTHTWHSGSLDSGAPYSVDWFTLLLSGLLLTLFLLSFSHFIYSYIWT